MKLINFSKKTSAKQQPMAFILFGMAVYLASSFSQAYAVAFPTINVGSAPDITAISIDTNYDAGSDMFTANGFAAEYLFDNSLAKVVILNGGFNLSAMIDDAGNLVSGTVIVTGNVLGSGPTLLEGTITDFLSGAANDPFQFIFNVTGGDLAPVYGPVGGLVLSDPGFSGSFASNFSNTFVNADIAAVPVPAALWMLATGILSLAGFARRRDAMAPFLTV